MSTVKFSMDDYIQGFVDECVEDLEKGSVTMLPANHLFQVDSNAMKLRPTEGQLNVISKSRLRVLCMGHREFSGKQMWGLWKSFDTLSYE